MKVQGFLRSALSVVLVVLLVAGVSPACSIASAAAHVNPTQAKLAFERHEVVLGSAERPTVVTGFLLGGSVADLAVVHVDDHGDRHLRIYTFSDGTWAAKLDATLRPGVLFVDVANLGGRDRLITYEPGRLNWFDPESATEHLLVAVACDYHPPAAGAVPHVDITRDLNDDQLDDLVVPDAHGFWVLTQTPDGRFDEPVKIGPSAGMARIYGTEGYRHDPWTSGRIHQIDYNRDGRRDLTFWSDDHFQVYLQDPQGRFGDEVATFTTDVAFDSDELATLAAPHGVNRRRTDRMVVGNMSGRVLHSLTDINGDGVGDLVVFSLKSGGTLFGQMSQLWDMHADYEVYFGSPSAAGGTSFAPELDTVSHLDGIAYKVKPQDFDRDGQIDLMFIRINPGIFKAMGMLIDAAVTESVSLDLELYRMTDGVYPDKPTTTRKLRTISLGDSGQKASRLPACLLGDLNGDGRSELVVQQGRSALHVFLGVPGPGLFTRSPHKIAVNLPNAEYTWLVDLNRDGRQDILIHQPSQTEPQRLTMLIAR